MNKRKKILIAPLDWGIGHASRCVPIIKVLQEKDVDMVIASSGRSASFLRSEFPELEHLDLPGFEMTYPHHGSMSLRMLRRSPVILSANRREHRMVNALIRFHDIDALISDNRFGVSSASVPSIYITHQLSIKAPPGWSFTEGLLYMMHRKYIGHYDECWIPDTEEDGGLSGDLAHKRKSPIPTYFIGPLSRFEPARESHPKKKYDVMAVISGPEPQRSIFEELILNQLKDTKLKAMVILGKPELDEHKVIGNIEVHSHMSSKNIQSAMLSSGLIICRPGYSSIMDLAILGKPAVFVPTPGQTEQEYLAAYHQSKHQYYSVPQSDFDLEKSIQASGDYTGILIDQNKDILDARLDELLSRL